MNNREKSTKGTIMTFITVTYKTAKTVKIKMKKTLTLRKNHSFISLANHVPLQFSWKLNSWVNTQTHSAIVKMTPHKMQ